MRKIFHCLATYEEATEREKKRKAWAKASWEKLYEQGVVKCDLRAPWKRSDAHFKAPTRLPYIRDIIEPAMQQAGLDDIIFYTNNDIICHPDLPAELRYYCSIWGAVAIQRCEFAFSPPPPLDVPPSAWAKKAQNVAFRHCGRDTFAFTKRWMLQWWDTLPDFLVGTTDWDNCMVVMIRAGIGFVSDAQSFQRLIWPAEMPLGWTAHIKHPSDWEAPYNIETSAPNRYNRRLFREWCAKFSPNLVFDDQNHLVK